MPFIRDDEENVLDILGKGRIRKIAARNRTPLARKIAVAHAMEAIAGAQRGFFVTAHTARKAGVVISGEASTKRHRVVRSKKSPAVKVKRRRK